MVAHVAYIALGSNLGDRRAHIETAVQRLRGDPGVLSLQLSSLHETAPVGGPAGQGLYLNAAARMETTYGPEVLLGLLLSVEREMGRVRNERWGPRTIDLDLLFYDELVMETPELTVPHPRMHERRFVLAPLVEIAGWVRDPRSARTVSQLLKSLQ